MLFSDAGLLTETCKNFFRHLFSINIIISAQMVIFNTFDWRLIQSEILDRNVAISCYFCYFYVYQSSERKSIISVSTVLRDNDSGIAQQTVLPSTQLSPRTLSMAVYAPIPLLSSGHVCPSPISRVHRMERPPDRRTVSGGLTESTRGGRWRDRRH